MMSKNIDTAKQFVEACDSGRGWEVCSAFCRSGATLSAQTTVLAEFSTVEEYCEWMKGLFTPIPDGHYELKFLASDEAGDSVVVYAVFLGTQTGEGGPVPPTGNSVATDYVYHLEFEEGRIAHMTKIWNDAVCLRQLGWG